MLTDQLKYFVSAAKNEHLGRAAEQLDLSQPALSRSIQKLEEELGLPLFDRVGRGVRLNEAGKILLRRVERAQAEVEDALRELHDHSGTKTVSVGYFATFGVRLIPELVKGFVSRNPNLQFKFFEAPSPLLAKQLLAGEIDVCISTDMRDPTFEWRPLFKEELFALVPIGHRLAGRESIELIELADEPFVALREGHGLRVVLDDLCQQAGFTPTIRFEGYEVASLRGLVASGLGVTLAPRRTNPVATYIDLPISTPRCFRTIGISWRGNRWLAPKALAFKDYVMREITSTDLRGAGQSARPTAMPNSGSKVTSPSTLSVQRQIDPLNAARKVTRAI